MSHQSYKISTIVYARGQESIQIFLPSKPKEEPLTIEITTGSHDIHRMYVDGGASADIMYEHYFKRLRPEIQKQLSPATTSLTGFTEKRYGLWGNYDY